MKERRRLKEFQLGGQAQELPPIQYTAPRPVLMQGDPGVRLVQSVTVSSPRVRSPTSQLWPYFFSNLVMSSTTDTPDIVNTLCLYLHSILSCFQSESNSARRYKVNALPGKLGVQTINT